MATYGARPRGALLRVGALLVSVASLLGTANLWAQAGGASAPAPSAAPSPSADSPREIGIHNQAPTFKVRVNLVQVRVVVRDSKGNAVGDLQKTDFQLFDKGKPQVISEFSVESASKRAATAAGKTAPAASSGALQPALVVPERYVAYVFDDAHLAFADLVRIRDAAIHNLASRSPTERVALFTTSGQGNVDFTTDHARLEAALRQLRPRYIGRSPIFNCISDYQADLIVNQKDSTTKRQEPAGNISLAVNQNDSTAISLAKRECNSFLMTRPEVEAEARKVLFVAARDSQLSITAVRDVIRRLAMLSGQRLILLLSPGFYLPELHVDYEPLIEQAVRAQVVISSLNARGLYYIDPLGDITGLAPAPGAMGERIMLTQATAAADEDILGSLAYGTGGSYFHNDNGLEEGLREISALPDYVYVLGFTPQNLKLDGKFHELKVTVRNYPHLTVQARKGYYAPANALEGTEDAERKIEPSIFLHSAAHTLEKQLEDRADGSQAGNLSARMALPYFYTSANTARVNLALEIPTAPIKFEQQVGRLHAAIDVLGMACGPDGSVAARFSDTVPLDLPDRKAVEEFRQRPLHYENQFAIASGQYILKVAFASGDESFGKLEVPLVIDPYDVKQFSLSGLALSRQVHPAEAMPEGLELSDRIPLLVRGMQVVPTGDSHFHQGDSALVYAQIYEPLQVTSPASPLQVQLSYVIVDRNRGVKPVDTVIPVDLASLAKPGTPVIPVGLKVPVQTLPPGSYRAELKATDSAGHSSPLRTVEFEVE